MTTSENTGDVMVDIRSLRDFIAGTRQRHETSSTMISRDRGNLFFDRPKSRSKPSLHPVSWWARQAKSGTLETTPHRLFYHRRSKRAASRGFQRNFPNGSVHPGSLQGPCNGMPSRQMAWIGPPKNPSHESLSTSTALETRAPLPFSSECHPFWCDRRLRPSREGHCRTWGRRAEHRSKR